MKTEKGCCSKWLVSSSSSIAPRSSANAGAEAPAGSGSGLCRGFCLATTDPLTVVSRGYGRIDDRAVSRLG